MKAIEAHGCEISVLENDTKLFKGFVKVVVKTEDPKTCVPIPGMVKSHNAGKLQSAIRDVIVNAVKAERHIPPAPVKMTLRDVQVKLLAMYKEFGADNGKSHEGMVELGYPCLWETLPGTDMDYFEPDTIIIHSYCLGPNRRHYVTKGERLQQTKSDRWEGPCIYGAAMFMLNMWVVALRKEGKGEL